MAQALPGPGDVDPETETVIASSSKSQALIDGLVRSTGETDPVAAIRKKARAAIDAYVAVFGEPEEMPLDLLVLASFLGIKPSADAPLFSPDAELAPDGDGGVEMRLNRDRPETRQRFSVGHEITHTFFPDHTSHIWPRADARHRDLSDPSHYLEMLCDVGASELVFPLPFFSRDATGVSSAADLVVLSRRYQASREATVRRYAELSAESMAAAFFSWKLKPAQEGRVGNPAQRKLFGVPPEIEALAARRLRVQYCIPSSTFSSQDLYVPKDKSVPSKGPLYEAARTRLPTDGECHLDLGASSGAYLVHAVPLWTPPGETGPEGESGVAAILRPLRIRVRRKSTGREQPGWFD
jgi:Zn-dependent peptidase ImmA (M78 family)